MNNYIDGYGLYNVEPCKDGKPSGNDGMILTAVADKMGLPVDDVAVTLLYMKLKCRDGLPIERLPGKETPYPSRDFFLGCKWFGFVKPTGWNFSPFELPPFNPFKTICSFILAIGEHRNYLWKHDLRHAYRFMYSVPLSDRWFYCYKVPFHYWLIKQVDKRLSGSKASCLVRYLKYGVINMDHFTEYFSPHLDNPVYLRAKEIHEVVDSKQHNDHTQCCQ
jgi:hypothetical protein